MFARVFALLPLVALVAATQCTTSSPNCCNKVESASSPEIQNALQGAGFGLIGSVLAEVGAVVGLQCTGIVGDGADCSQTPICCEDNFSTGIGVICSPISVA